VCHTRVCGHAYPFGELKQWQYFVALHSRHCLRTRLSLRGTETFLVLLCHQREQVCGHAYPYGELKRRKKNCQY